MTGAHWAFLGILALSFGLMLCFSLFAIPGSRSYRLARKALWSGFALLLMSMLLPLHLNPISWTAAACLGAPGIGLLLALHFI